MGWIQNISNMIGEAFDAIRPPLTDIPALLLVCEIASRPGISAIAVTANVIRRLPEIGIPTGVNPDGSPNLVNGFVKIMCEEMVRELKTNARIDSVINSNQIMIRGTGGNIGGPVEVFGNNIMSVLIKGILR